MLRLLKMLFLASLAWNIDLLGSTFLGRGRGQVYSECSCAASNMQQLQ